MRIIPLILIAISLTNPVYAKDQLDFNKLADAIHHAENGARLDQGGEAYGIHTVHYSNESKARGICIRTIRHKWLEWSKKGIGMPFLEYLSRHYCPVNHKVWLKNVSYYYGSG